MWVRRDYFPPHFLSLLFSLLNQTVKNIIFHLIFLSQFSILPIFTTTKHTLSFGGRCRGFNIYPKDLRLRSRVNKCEKKEYLDRAIHVCLEQNIRYGKILLWFLYFEITVNLVFTFW